MALRDRLDLAFAGDVTLGTLIERLVRIRGDRRLVTEHGGRTLSYPEAAAMVERWAGAVAGRIAPGGRVVVQLPNGYDVFLACLAVSRAGGVPVPVSDRLQAFEVDHIVSDSDAALVLRSTDELEAKAMPITAAAADPLDVAAILYTSGTTGRPKGAELTHRALVGMAASGGLWPSRRRAEAVSGMPVGHVAGFTMLLMLATMGIPTYLLRRFDAGAALDAIEERRCSMFIGVPAMYRMLLDAGAEERDLRSVRLWASGADVMPHDLAQRFQRMGAAVRVPGLGAVGNAAFVDGYGMVELGGGAAVKVSPPGPAGLRLFTMPLPRFQLRVVDDDGRPVPRGEVGELVVRGPGVMVGYHGSHHHDPALTPDGWLRTGDLARRRPLGLFELVGRKKEVVKRGGHSVFPAEVAEVLERHPGVAEAVVLGRADERLGEVPVAVVVRRAGAAPVDGAVGGDAGEPVSEQALIEWVAGHLAHYKVPERIAFVDVLPRTGTHKVRKDDLRPLFDRPSDVA